MNWTKSAKTLAYTIDPAWYGMITTDTWKVTVSNPDGEFVMHTGPLNVQPGSIWLGRVVTAFDSRFPAVVRFEKQAGP